ncbi:MAG TPA: ergothioneine biosynthesis protein EgtB [Burkholderiales bacterium]|jgi:ergothioneine biosynthesis protein EgtB|nr:ergothioneine biosynthesis protein EgtB [Burkholderiales bacterium]
MNRPLHSHPNALTRTGLLGDLRRVRDLTVRLCDPLQAEDCVVQSAPETSPAKWHLAHTTWFFENFLLVPYLPKYRPFHPRFGFLFNSYYESVGEFHPRLQRGLLSRPSLEEIKAYRDYVDQHIGMLLEAPGSADAGEIRARATLGIHHEQQHQELLLTDIKHLFACNPLKPAYRETKSPDACTIPLLDWLRLPAGMYAFGHGGDGFAFDNETPRHRRYLDEFSLASRPITNAEYIEFIAAGGYRQPTLWLSDGWRKVNEARWIAPLYWEQQDGDWWQMTLAGYRCVDPSEPVCHVSYYEADAFARWAGKRLPTEFEWEAAAGTHTLDGNFLESESFHPQPTRDGASQFFGDVWEWTQSAYSPYPGYRPPAGALGEYNGKFMVSQLVLRGGSCVTPAAHIRASYRNFFYPQDRWQFMGIRLAA